MPVNIQLSKIINTQMSGARFQVPANETDTWNLKPSFMVGLGRVELPTSPLSGVRSSHLSYRPGCFKIPRPIPEPKFAIGRRPSVVGQTLDEYASGFGRRPKTNDRRLFFEDMVERAAGLSPA